MIRIPAPLPACLALCLSAGPLLAQDTKPAIAVQLNAAETVDQACRLTFVVRNSHTAAIDQLVYETVLFTDTGQVASMTLFDFGMVPVGRPRVRQFDVGDLTCDGLGQVLINGAQTCTVGGTAQGICDSSLTVSSRLSVEILG